MRIRRRFLIMAIVLASIPLVSAFSALPEKIAAPTQGADPLARPAGGFVWEGVGSCASSSCHGSLEKTATPKQSAVTIWTRDDPHAQSYFSLRTPRSRDMVRRLRQLKNNAEVHPETDPICLKCHAMGIPEDLQGAKFDHTEGVGCESCHGASGKWKAMHDLPSWQTLTEEQKASYGMRSLRNPLVRADACARCHQGAPDREVNHDIIAAGHPALIFDVSAQMYRLPHHWDRNIDNQQPDFSARFWVSGQMIGVRNEMENLAARASDPEKPWPEFAVQDCIACHRPPHLNPLRPVLGVPRGIAPYVGWSQPMTRVLAEQGRFANPELPPLLDKLTAEMNKALPERKTVTELAAAIQARLDVMLGKLQGTTYTKNDVLALMRTVVADHLKEPEGRWYTGVQIAIGLTALNKALSELDPTTPRPEVLELLKELRERYPSPVEGGWQRQSERRTTVDLLTPLLEQLK